jgi:phosphoglycolate phosphatase-like HAD superfamily hydrolase
MADLIPDHIRAVFFDHDDTLVATREAKYAHHKHVALKHYGKTLTDADIEPHWGKPLKELVCILYSTDNAEEALANNAECHEDFPKLLYPYTISTLQHVHALGKKIGIITATSTFSFEHDLTLHGFPRKIIDYTQTSDDTPFHKPDPRVFEPAVAWLSQHRIKPEEVIYVGDGLHDMKAALGAGFHFIGVETGLVTAEQFKEHGATTIPTVGHLAHYNAEK